MTKIYLIRHANAEERQDTQRARLTEHGIKQAEALAKRLTYYDIHVFYSSSYFRSRHTAQIIAELHKEKIVKETKELIEVDFRVSKRLSLGSFKELKNIYTKPEVEQIQNLLTAQKRALKLLNYLFRAHPDQNIAVVTHGNIIKAIILGIFQLKLSGFQRIVISEASLSVVSGTSIDNARIITLNDTAHLKKIVVIVAEPKVTKRAQGQRAQGQTSTID